MCIYQEDIRVQNKNSKGKAFAVLLNQFLHPKHLLLGLSTTLHL
jgi:hypothetical protein